MTAAFNEKLLFGNGMVASPVRDDGDGSGSNLSVREMVQQVDNERDLQQYIMAHSHSVPARPAEIRYEKHPVSINLPYRPNIIDTSSDPCAKSASANSTTAT